MSIFREYDIRGIYQQDLTKDSVFKIGKALGDEITKRGAKSVAIGYDARTHSPILFEWLCNGLANSSLQIYDLGMIPTPVAYFSLYSEKISVDSSIMITGSHNPPEYNGFKITILKEPFYGEDIKNLGQIINKDNKTFKATQPKIQKVEILKEYIDFLVKHFSCLRYFKHKIAIDCGNGVAGIALKEVLDTLNIPYLPLYFEPDGTFPNHHPDPSEEKNLIDLKKAMRDSQIQIGIAFDGDADRLGVVSENYSFKGDELAILFAKKMLENGIKPIVIGEVKCSMIMYDEINKIGKAIMYKTGHSNLKVKLKETRAHLAAEMSGHIFFNDRYFGYDDAIYSALRVLELFTNKNIKDIEKEILSLPQMYSTSEEKIQSSEEKKFEIISNLIQKLKNLQNQQTNFPQILEIITIDGVRVIFKDGWGLIRASNTTPVLVTRFEAKDKKTAESYKKALLDLLKE